jgi:hypothetical protein
MRTLLAIGRVTVSFFATFGGCAVSQNSDFVAAEIRVLTSGLHRLQVKEISEPSTVRALTEFFPGVGREPRSHVEVGYYSTIRIVLRQRDGQVIRVHINRDRTSWNAGRGEQFNLKPGLEQFIQNLMRDNTEGDAQAVKGE